MPAANPPPIAPSLPVPDFCAIFDVLPGLYLVLLPNDPAFTIVAVNRAYSRAALASPAELIGRSLFEIFPVNPDEPEATAVRNLHSSLSQVLATKAPHTMAVQKYNIRHPESEGGHFEERYWTAINSPLFSSDGSVQFIIHSVEDVTKLTVSGLQLTEVRRLLHERDAAERQLRASQARFSLAFAEAPNAMAITAADGRILEVNRKYSEMLGYTREETLSRTSAFLTHPDDIAATTQFFADLSAHNRYTGSLEKRYISKDGRQLWVRASVTIQRDTAGQPTETIAIIEDITERKRAEARYRFLAESIPQIVWTATPEGKLDYISAQGTAYFGPNPDCILGSRGMDAFHPEDRAQVAESWSNSVTSGDPFEVTARLRRHTDGVWRWHLIRALALRGDPDGILQWFGTNTDITEQRAIQENLLRSNRELEEFAYVASHDLKEPLRAINIYTGLILQNLATDDPKLLQYAGFVRQGVRRMEALINDLLAFSRSVHAEDASQCEADLSAALAEALFLLKSQIEETGAVIHASPLPAASGDTAQMVHVFQNIISNALKYCRPGISPEIHVDAGYTAGEVLVSIRDNGIGFEPRYAERIFGLFKRLHKDEYPGTGLGLAICKRIVESAGGRIWAESASGEGAAFFFTLPTPQHR